MTLRKPTSDDGVELSKRLLETMARFSDERKIEKGDPETRMCIVACQALLATLVANHSEAAVLEDVLAETHANGTFAEYVAQARKDLNQHKERMKQ